MISRLSVKDVNGISLILGALFSLIPFVIQLFLYDIPKDGEHIFTFFSNQIILNGSISLFNALLSIFGATFTAYGLFGLFNDFKKDKSEKLMSLGLFLFLFASVGFIISWSQDFMIVWGDANFAPNQMMVELSLIFAFGIHYWAGLAIFSYSLSQHHFLNTNFLYGLSIISTINVFLIVYTLFTLDPYNVSSLNLLYLGFIIGNIVFYIFCLLTAFKILPKK